MRGLLYKLKLFFIDEVKENRYNWGNQEEGF